MGVESVRFNSNVCLEFVHIDAAPAFHLVDDATRFIAAAFFEPTTTDKIWETLLTLWVNVYTGIPE